MLRARLLVETTEFLVAGSSHAGLALLPGPAGVLGVPRLVALLHPLQRLFGVGRGRVRTKDVPGGAHVRVRLDSVVSRAPVVLLTTSAVAHGITVHRESTKRYRFAQKAAISSTVDPTTRQMGGKRGPGVENHSAPHRPSPERAGTSLFTVRADDDHASHLLVGCGLL
jgi:hypothetical protein